MPAPHDHLEFDDVACLPAPNDSVATATRRSEAGTRIQSLEGHRFVVAPIARGATSRHWGWPLVPPTETWHLTTTSVTDRDGLVREAKRMIPDPRWVATCAIQRRMKACARLAAVESSDTTLGDVVVTGGHGGLAADGIGRMAWVAPADLESIESGLAHVRPTVPPAGSWSTSYRRGRRSPHHSHGRLRP